MPGRRGGRLEKGQTHRVTAREEPPVRSKVEVGIAVGHLESIDELPNKDVRRPRLAVGVRLRERDELGKGGGCREGSVCVGMCVGWMGFGASFGSGV